MNQVVRMQASFELEKNRKALTYTLIICVVLLLLAFTIHWKIETPPVPVPEELIEVNLGNDNEGEGIEQPLVKGQMSENASPDPAPVDAGATAAAPDEPAPDENDDADAAPVTKAPPAIVKKNTPKPVIKPAPVKNPSPAVVSVPKPRNPKSTYKGPGDGNGNGALDDNGFRSQGNVKGGKGDKGVPTGKPDSYGNDPGGKSGVTVVRGARPFNLGQLRFEDDFNENAKVYLDIRYNSAGTFVSATVVKPTGTTNATILGIARRKASSLKFPTSEDGGITTIMFNFKVQN